MRRARRGKMMVVVVVVVMMMIMIMIMILRGLSTGTRGGDDDNAMDSIQK